jgi:hypothetical protein
MATPTHFAGPVHSERGFAPGANSVWNTAAATALTLTSAENGKVFSLEGAGAAITLPAVTNEGWTAKFIVGANFDTSDWVITSAETGNLEGAINVVNVLTTVAAADTITFEQGAENIGDWIEVVSNGTYWLVTGVGLLASSITVA